MAGEKDFERAVRAVWEELRKERRARRKLVSATDLILSAERLKQFAHKLEVLSAQAPSADLSEAAAANDAAPAPATGAPKPKRKGRKKAAKKAKKKPSS